MWQGIRIVDAFIFSVISLSLILVATVKLTLETASPSGSSHIAHQRCIERNAGNDQFYARPRSSATHCSLWASQVVLIPKKDGSLRFCISYWRLNSTTRKNVYPLPLVDDLIGALAGVKYFSSLDIASGY